VSETSNEHILSSNSAKRFVLGPFPAMEMAKLQASFPRSVRYFSEIGVAYLATQGHFLGET
jgi:hypothetical protein